MNSKINNSLETIEPSNFNAEAVGLIASTMLGVALKEKEVPTDLEANRRLGVERLQEMGLLIPIENLDMYHGRVDTVDGHKTWKIDPNYDNARYNVHNVPSIYASQKKEDADAFAFERGREMVHSRQFELVAGDIATEDCEQVRDHIYEREIKRWMDHPVSRSSQHNLKTGEVVWHETPIPEPKRDNFGNGPLTDKELRTEAYRRYDEMDEDGKEKLWSRAATDLHVFVEKIIANDRESSLIDLDFFTLNEFNEEQKTMLRDSLRQMLHEVVPVDSLSEIELSLLDQAQALVTRFVSDKELASTSEAVKISEQDIDELVEKSGLPEDYIFSYAAVYNARQLLLKSPTRAVDVFVKTKRPFTYESYDTRDIPIAAFYIESFCRNNKIIGAKVNLNSTTIDRAVETVSLFNTNAITATKLSKGE